jgi:hypothetical protein
MNTSDDAVRSSSSCAALMMRFTSLAMVLGGAHAASNMNGTLK